MRVEEALVDKTLPEFSFVEENCSELAEIVKPLRAGEHRAFFAFLLVPGNRYVRDDLVNEIDFIFDDSPYKPSPEVVFDFYSQIDESLLCVDEQRTVSKPVGAKIEKIEASAGVFLELALSLPFSTRKITGAQGSKSTLTNLTILDQLTSRYPDGAAIVEFLDPREHTSGSPKTKAIRTLHEAGILIRTPIPDYEYSANSERLNLSERTSQQRLILVAINRLLDEGEQITTEIIREKIGSLKSSAANEFNRKPQQKQYKRVAKVLKKLVEEGELSRLENVRDRNERLRGNVSDFYTINPEYRENIEEFLLRMKLIAAGNIDIIEEFRQKGYTLVRGHTEGGIDAAVMAQRGKLLQRMYDIVENPRRRIDLGRIAIS